jgi:restriction endonuclease S subunit
VAFIENDTNYLAGGFMGIIRTKENSLSKYLFQLLNSVLRQQIRDLGSGSNINNLSSVINDIKIPLPPLEIQQKIVSEIEVLEKKENGAKEKIEKLKNKIEQNFRRLDSNANETLRLSDTDIFDISIGKRVLSDEVTAKGIPVFSANVFEPFGLIDTYLITDFSVSSVLWGIDGD